MPDFVISVLEIDECMMNVCDQVASCANNQGSHNCTCISGNSEDGLNCTDRFGFLKFLSFNLLRDVLDRLCYH